jgi:hypothetical protein
MRSQGNHWQRNDGQANKPENFSSHSSAHHSPAASFIKEMILTDCSRVGSPSEVPTCRLCQKRICAQSAHKRITMLDSKIWNLEKFIEAGVNAMRPSNLNPIMDESNRAKHYRQQ